MKKAFTLAEVLITLGIIGVVAAMTLPTVINNIQNRQLETGLKKAYSTINQALDLYYTENGERFVPIQTAHTLKPILMKYIKNIKDCGYGTGAGYICSAKSKEYFTEVYKTFNGGSNINQTYFDDGQFVINDGMLVLLEDAITTNKFISVDVNGYKKKPNRLGQDLFMFQIDANGKLLPMGVSGTNYSSSAYCSQTSSAGMNGAGCTAKALSEKDYFKNLPK